jgi:hypothetical protein
MPETKQYENVSCERRHEVLPGGPRFTDARTIEVDAGSNQIQIINHHPKPNKAPSRDVLMSPGTRISRESDGVTVTIGGRVVLYGVCTGRYRFQNEQNAQHFQQFCSGHVQRLEAQAVLQQQPVQEEEEQRLEAQTEPQQQPVQEEEEEQRLEAQTEPQQQPVQEEEEQRLEAQAEPQQQEDADARAAADAQVAVRTFQDSVRSGRSSAISAMRRFYELCGTHVVRTYGNNNHPRRYAHMCDGSVVDTDKLTQPNATCWIRDERAVRALLQDFGAHHL